MTGATIGKGRGRLGRVVTLAAMIGLFATTARGAAPVGRYDVGAETVLDVATGLTWQRVPPVSWYTWAAAKTYCANLVLAGFSDWRLPNVRELQSLVDVRGAQPPAVDQDAFPELADASYWSSSPRGTTLAWYVHLGLGYSGTQTTTGSYRVLCVR